MIYSIIIYIIIAASSDRDKVIDAFGIYSKYTCVRFVPATDRDQGKIFFLNGDGCSSSVGFHNRRQAVSLAPGCRQVRT